MTCVNENLMTVWFPETKTSPVRPKYVDDGKYPNTVRQYSMKDPNEFICCWVVGNQNIATVDFRIFIHYHIINKLLSDHNRKHYHAYPIRQCQCKYHFFSLPQILNRSLLHLLPFCPLKQGWSTHRTHLASYHKCKHSKNYDHDFTTDTENQKHFWDAKAGCAFFNEGRFEFYEDETWNYECLWDVVETSESFEPFCVWREKVRRLLTEIIAYAENAREFQHFKQNVWVNHNIRTIKHIVQSHI